MKVAVIGAGAIGGLVGARLAKAGEDVTFLVRGANLETIAAHGIKLIEKDGTEHVERNVRATDDYARAGPQDVVVLAVKANQVDAVALEGAVAVRPRDRRRDDAERHPVLVLPSPRPGRSKGARSRASIRPAA